MYSFCPHCGNGIDQEQRSGQMLRCIHCHKEIGLIGRIEQSAQEKATTLQPGGNSASCPICQQTVELRPAEGTKKFVPHYGITAARKICAGSGKLLATDQPVAPIGKDLSAFMTRDRVNVIFCELNAKPTIEILTLEYLDKADRVRIQIEALREMLGPIFRMGEYPAHLHRTQLAVWRSSDACVVAKQHDQGGIASMADAELAAVLADLGQHQGTFFV